MYDTICMYIMHMNGAMYCVEDNVIVTAWPPSGPEPMRRYSLRDEWSLVSKASKSLCRGECRGDDVGANRPLRPTGYSPEVLAHLEHRCAYDRGIFLQKAEQSSLVVR